jgi:hypothetical protein
MAPHGPDESMRNAVSKVEPQRVDEERAEVCVPGLVDKIDAALSGPMTALVNRNCNGKSSMSLSTWASNSSGVPPGGG